jgi:CMP-N,N'-diacetyllegionaminic acid synthase
MRVLGLIPARGGSKGIPWKNIKDLFGKPLIAWTIETALNCSKLDRVVVTTDDPEIASVAKSYGADVPFIRPSELAQDSTPGIEPVLHAIGQLPDFDWVLLLQPTSPLRSLADIDGIIDCVCQKKGTSAVSLCSAPVHPYWIYKTEESKLLPFLKREFVSSRQDLPPAYSINGALYLSTVRRLVKTKSFIDSDTIPYIMPKARSYDIDDHLDFQIVESLIKRK